ncbi:ER lumen protein retaining receptor [Helicosporidium sp. ATCC 50920]|nr:ER lumen protein retaining receptor [Helicosporidium sp. ATCC 50920]|eukprot:KDD74845.1 ER lumen protein retaining receptor [Helicosporidium sp. ATCC 50920]
MDDRYGGKANKDSVLAITRWFKSRSQREKTYMGVIAGLAVRLRVSEASVGGERFGADPLARSGRSYFGHTLILLWFVIEDHDTLFVMSEGVHFLGIGALAYKLIRQRHCGGLSLRTQELTAAFLVIRLFCSFMMEYDIHTVLDLLTLIATGSVVYALRGPLRDSYQRELDVLGHAWVLLPCAVLALVAHPSTRHNIAFRLLWAFCVYLEAVSVLPQLRMMQRARVVEKFTAHYVFALGASRFISCAHWILQILDGDRYLWQALGLGIWPVMVLLSEVVQTFILTDFCYYYVKSYAEGTGVIHLPAGIV